MSGPVRHPSLLPWLRSGSDPLPDPTPLAGFGLTVPTEAVRVLRRMGSGLCGRFWRTQEQVLAAALATSPDPQRALTSLERIEDPDLLRELAGDGSRLCDLARVLGVGGFASGQLLRWPDDLRWLFLQGGLEKPADQAVLERIFPPDRDRPSLLLALNRLRRREQIRMIARAALGRSRLEEELAALSRLADRILEVLLERLWPSEVPHPAVLALGKLGGGELNFSSDLDLIFAQDVAEGAVVAEQLPRVVTAVEQLVGALTEYTDEGSLYRIDLRLRPGGDRSPLVRSVRGLEAYYARHGVPWERQMLVKARACAGDRSAGSDLIARLAPFIYPTHSGPDPREEAHRHRRERRAREGGAPAGHVKLAPGGIRDLEFVVQVLQLLYGGRRPEVRSASTLDGIARLDRAGLLPERAADGLAGAYRFLRRLENFLQMEEDRQTFQVPEEPVRQQSLARLMGLADATALREAYDAHRERVLETLHGLLPGLGEREGGDPLEALLNLPAGGEEAAALLKRRGFLQPAQTHRVLTAAGANARAEGTGAWSAWVGLLPPLLEDAVRTGAPDRALNNLERVMRRLGTTGSYARLLAREAPLRRALLTLCASGELLTDLLVRHPEHFERLFSLQAAGVAADRTAWRRRLRQERRVAPGAPELARRLESLRCREALGSGLAYVAGETDLDGVMVQLGLLAQDLLRLFLGRHFRDHLQPPRVAVLALGTLADGAMTFASDADLMFLHEAGYGAEVQSLTGRAAGLLTPPGGPYPVDMRLRPEGRSAPTSADLTYLRSYLYERASPWEALALGRIQPFYGRRRMLQEALAVIEEWLEDFRLDTATRKELRGIRRRQENESRKEIGATGAFDVKRSPGGMADIEYLAVGLSMDGFRLGLPRPRGIPALLDALAAAGRLPADEAARLCDFYRHLRGVQVGLQLHYGRDATRLPVDWGDDPVPIVLSGRSPRTLAPEAGWVREVFGREFPG